MDRAAAILLLLTLCAGCSEATATSPAAAPTATGAPNLSATPSQGTASPTPIYQPGPHSAGGVVLARTSIGVLIGSVERREEVDLRSVLDVWRETSVAASTIEIGDDLFLNGSRGRGAFVARYVWANIGRLDGVIRAIDATGMTIAAQRAGYAPREQRVDFSPFVEVVRVGPALISASRVELNAGSSIGMVLYRPRDGVPRATRIWLSP